MNRRQAIGFALVALVVVANVALWYARQEPVRRPPNARATIHKQLTSHWRDLPARPIGEAKAAIGEALDFAAGSGPGRDAAEVRRVTSFQSLPDDSRADLLDALTGAVAAIAAGQPEALRSYMQARGMAVDAKAVGSAGGAGREGFASLFAAEQVDPHWAAVVPEATSVRVWQPRSLRNVSMVQLGENESWVWDNETVIRSPFVSRPTFVEVSRRDPAMLADARVLIEHDDALKNERSPYFFRFWRCETPPQWRPLALKLVRTTGEKSEAAPVILF
ncbi:hypothetical protein Pla108_36470 [Botrimarina colliarenosi]|uniref:Uncharacterized protein n=1 Tax=Botrimarina colliarenosi TaxID=2528001 RepID=A0A5C6A628_9BACT|nr:hypothetical protein [Botrimarina colliarenosi]TWT94797.1 hypothetical protein Pla108_36470 [Botrimarina colliarenosi]